MDKGKLTGIGERWQQFTKLTGLMLGEEANYRLFSAMTHGHLWAASQLGFRFDAGGAGSPLAVSDALPIVRVMPASAPGSRNGELSIGFSMMTSAIGLPATTLVISTR